MAVVELLPITMERNEGLDYDIICKLLHVLHHKHGLLEAFCCPLVHELPRAYALWMTFREDLSIIWLAGGMMGGEMLGRPLDGDFNQRQVVQSTPGCAVLIGPTIPSLHNPTRAELAGLTAHLRFILLFAFLAYLRLCRRSLYKLACLKTGSSKGQFCFK